MTNSKPRWARHCLWRSPATHEDRFLDQLQGQARLDTLWSGDPATDEVPDAQAEEFGGEQPQAEKVARDLVGQELAYATFQAECVAGDGPGASLGGLDRQGRLRVRTVAIEFFFQRPAKELKTR